MKKAYSHPLAEETSERRSRAGRLLAPGALLFLSLLTTSGMLLFIHSGVQAQSTGKSSDAGSAPAGNVETGKKLFTSYGCYECHGRAAHGGTGPRLGPDALPFAAFVQYIRHPAGTGMPPYTAKVASEQDLADIYAFLKTLPVPPQAKSIPLLNQ